MLGVDYHVAGDLKVARAAIARAHPDVLAREVFVPFINWVLRKRVLTMYWRGGQVAGSDGQGKWAALSKWTIASKGVGKFTSGAGARGNVITPMVTALMKMAQSYAISYQRTGTASWRFELTNKARSTSKWSPGFDYPSALHEGWGPYTVKPRPGGPGILIWAMRKGTIIGGSMGRGETFGSLLRSGSVRLKSHGYLYRKGGKASRTEATVTRNSIAALVTHPKGAPPRPHIRFFAIDAIKLGDLALRFVFRGVKSPEAAGGDE